MGELRGLTTERLAAWVGQGWLSSDQATRIREELSPGGDVVIPVEGPKGLNILTAVYYLGALIIISALGWFLYDQWETLGAGGLMVVSSVYATLFAFAGFWLARHMSYPIAGGLLWTCAVWMVPLITYSVQKATGVWPGVEPGRYHSYYVWINGSWIVMELATVAVGFAVLRKIRFPFLLFPIAFALWFFSMDVAAILQRQTELDWITRCWCSVIVGALMLVTAYAFDHEYEEDFSFWLYLFGLIAFWGGLTSMDSGDEWRKAVYAAINIVLGFLGVYLQRKAFLVFGTMGIVAYLGHLAYRVFRDSALFPAALALVGLAVIFAAVYLQRHRSRIDAALNRYRPYRLRVS